MAQKRDNVEIDPPLRSNIINVRLHPLSECLLRPRNRCKYASNSEAVLQGQILNYRGRRFRGNIYAHTQ